MWLNKSLRLRKKKKKKIEQLNSSLNVSPVELIFSQGFFLYNGSKSKKDFHKTTVNLSKPVVNDETTA